MTTDIQAIDETTFRVHLPGEVNSRLVTFTPGGSECDGAACEGICEHIAVAEGEAFTADERILRAMFGVR